MDGPAPRTFPITPPATSKALPAPKAGTKAHAEAPAAAGDYVTALSRWQAILDGGRHPAAPVYCIRYLAMTGAVDRALASADHWLASNADRALLPIAARKLFVKGLGVPWVRVLDRLKDDADWPVEERQHSLARLSASDFLLDLPQPERGLAIRLLADADIPLPLSGGAANALALLGAATKPDDARRFAKTIQPSAEIFETAARRLLRRYAEARVDLDALIAFTTAYAGFADVVHFVGRRLLGQDGGEVMLRFMLAHPTHGWPGSQIQSAIAAALAVTEPWIIGSVIAREAAANPCASLHAQLLEELAAQTGNVPLSLAYCLASSAAGATALAALRMADRLAQLGFHRIGAQILDPFVEASEPAAFRYAQLLGRGIPASRSPEAFRRAARAHPSPRIQRGLAAALAEAGDYAAAFELYRAAASPEEGAAAFRQLAVTLERIGAHASWDALVTDLETRFPDDDWVAAERLKHDLETGAADRRAGGSEALLDRLRTHSLTTRRATVRYLTLKGRFTEVAETWRGIARRTDDANDHFHLVLAQCQAGDFEAASASATALLRKFPGDYRYRLKSAQLAERHGQYECALEHFAKALDTEATNLDSLAGIARCLTYLGRHERCDAWLDQHPANDIRASWSLASRAFNAARQGRREEAVSALSSIHALVRRDLVRIDDALAKEPGSMWLHGRILEGRSSRGCEVMTRFAADLAWLGDGAAIIVGNSPKLLGSGLGPRIDAFDRVIRLNDFRTQGLEGDVGARTDLWFSSANRLAKPNIGETGDARVWLYQPHAQHFPDLASFTRGRLGMSLPPSSTCYLPPHLHSITGTLIYPQPSTGLRMISMLEYVVQRPYHIAGFSFFHDAAIHYFEENDGRLQVGEVHAIAFERDFVQDVLSLSPFLNRIES